MDGKTLTIRERVQVLTDALDLADAHGSSIALNGVTPEEFAAAFPDAVNKTYIEGRFAIDFSEVTHRSPTGHGSTTIEAVRHRAPTPEERAALSRDGTETTSTTSMFLRAPVTPC